MQESLFSEIICVDDGSKDNTAQKIRSKWPAVKLVSLQQNSGKAAAVKQGLAVATSNYVLLMDADLRSIRLHEIKKALESINKDSFIDMLILRRVKAPWFFKIDRRDVLFSGERILRKADLQKILEKNVLGYQLEIAINHYMYRNNKNVKWMPWSASNTHKVKKWGWSYGLKREFLMFKEMIIFAGWQAYLIQILRFARKKVSA